MIEVNLLTLDNPDTSFMQHSIFSHIYASRIIAVLIITLITSSPVLASGNSIEPENKAVTTIVKEPGQSGYELLLEAANLPVATVGDSRAEIRKDIVSRGGVILTDTEQQLIARGVTEKGVEVKFNAEYYFTDNQFTRYADRITGKRISASYQQQFFDRLNDLCGRQFHGYSTFPDDPEDAFYGKLLIAEIASCTATEIRIPFAVGDDHSRTWVITRNDNSLTLKHDHRHADGSAHEVSNYGGTTTTYGSALSQSFPADQFTAELIPAAATNVWTISLSDDQQSMVYYLERHSKPRFRAELQLQSDSTSQSE